MSRVSLDCHEGLYKKGIRQIANLFGILVQAPRDRLGVFGGEVGCYRAGLALFEFIDDLGRMQRHVDRVIFGDDAVRGQQLHDLRSVVLIELAALDLNGLLGPTVAEAQELIEQRCFRGARDDDSEHKGIPARALRRDERPGLIDIDIHCFALKSGSVLLHRARPDRCAGRRGRWSGRFRGSPSVAQSQACHRCANIP